MVNRNASLFKHNPREMTCCVPFISCPLWTILQNLQESLFPFLPQMVDILVSRANLVHPAERLQHRSKRHSG